MSEELQKRLYDRANEIPHVDSTLDKALSDVIKFLEYKDKKPEDSDQSEDLYIDETFLINCPKKPQLYRIIQLFQTAYDYRKEEASD